MRRPDRCSNAQRPRQPSARSTENGGRRPLSVPDSVGDPFNAPPFSGDLSVEGFAGDQRAGRGLIRQRKGVAFSFALPPLNCSTTAEFTYTTDQSAFSVGHTTNSRAILRKEGSLSTIVECARIAYLRGSCICPNLSWLRDFAKTSSLPHHSRSSPAGRDGRCRTNDGATPAVRHFHVKF